MVRLAPLHRRQFLVFAAGDLASIRLAEGQAAQKRVGVLMAITSDDAEAPGRSAALAQGLSGQGWTAGGNVDVAYRWPGSDRDRTRAFARELVDLKPDLLVAHASPAAAELVALTKT